MNIRQCLIIEDSETAKLFLESYIKRFPLFQVADSCETYSEAMDILSSKAIDLVFLDVELPDISGIELLRSFPNMPPTIITSSHQKYAVDSYEIGRAVDFLVKPFTFERFTIAINRALGISLSKNSFQDVDFIMTKIGRSLKKFYMAKIDYIEADGIYSKVFYEGTSFLVNEIMTTLNTQLEVHHFIRVHKSYIVNIKKVTSIDAKYIYLGNTSIPIGRFYRPKLDGLLSLLSKDMAE